MRIILACALALVVPLVAAAQSPLPATDVTAADIRAFIDALPKDAISDRPIRVADVGGYKTGVYGVFRPQSSTQDAIAHEGTKVAEVYYMLAGTGTLVTGGRIVDRRAGTPGAIGSLIRGASIEGGVTRRVAPGDVVIIPGGTPHWWSHLDGDIRYLIVRPDPEGVQTVR